MKISNKILSGAFVGILGICIAVLLIIKISLNDSSTYRDTPVLKSSAGLKVIEMSGFNSLDLKGNWKVRIVSSDKENIRVNGPEDLLESLLVNQQGKSIELHMAIQRNDKRKLSLDITIPVIHSLRTRGVVDVSISGFYLEDLIIDSEGVSSIHGVNGRTDSLKFQGKGVSNLDLENFPTRKADLVSKGVVKIDLTMSGGELTGSIEGVGSVRYRGQANHESIRVKGSCKVTKL
jgi:hypothetical protein